MDRLYTGRQHPLDVRLREKCPGRKENSRPTDLGAIVRIASSTETSVSTNNKEERLITRQTTQTDARDSETERGEEKLK